MTPLREAVVLPALFLTVALLGGFRVAGTIQFVPPSLTALILGVLLLGTLTRGGILVPQVLMHGGRSPLENVSGGMVLFTLFAASGQAVNLVLPDRGLLHAAFAVFFFCQLMTMNAAGADRRGLLRSLLVLLGSLFVLRYIVVEALYAPDGGVLHRLLTTLMSGATLGGVAYQPNSPVTGYVAFVALALYVVGLLMLPKEGLMPMTVQSGRPGRGAPPAPPQLDGAPSSGEVRGIQASPTNCTSTPPRAGGTLTRSTGASSS